jgi:hypothetical protein
MAETLTSGSLTLEEEAVILAELMNLPLEEARVYARVGRGEPEPDRPVTIVAAPED